MNKIPERDVLVTKIQRRASHTAFLRCGNESRVPYLSKIVLDGVTIHRGHYGDCFLYNRSLKCLRKSSHVLYFI